MLELSSSEPTKVDDLDVAACGVSEGDGDISIVGWVSTPCQSYWKSSCLNSKSPPRKQSMLGACKTFPSNASEPVWPF